MIVAGYEVRVDGVTIAGASLEATSGSSGHKLMPLGPPIVGTRPER